MKDLVKTLGYAKNLWPYYAGITIFAILVALASIAIPFIIKGATDLIVQAVQGGQVDLTGALWLAAALFVFDVASTFFSNWGGYLGDMMAAKLRKQLSETYYEHLLDLPQTYYDSELTGTIINRLNRTIFEVTQFLNTLANNFFSMILMIVLTLSIVAFYSWEIASLLLIMYPIFLLLTMKTSKKWQRWQQEKNLETDIASGRFAEVVSQIKVTKSYVREKMELWHFSRRFQNTIDVTKQQSAYWHNMDIIRRLVLNGLFFAMFAFLFYGAVSGRFTIGEMVLIVQLLNMARMPIFSMSFIVDNFQKMITGCKDYADVMRIEPAIHDAPEAKELKVQKAKLTYEAVSFGYDKHQTVIHDVSFTIEPDQKVALVGQSGEGKSTLANLLMRLYEPDKGAVLIDDIDIASVTQRSLRESIATVFQDPSLFSGTIRENIAYSNPDASEEEIIAAAKAANAHDFIAKLEKGYETEIGERGLRLSGGQKQRIAIARALLKNAPILILDEATSSLDSRAEALVQEALDRLMKGRTTLIIAHRLSTIAHVDKIITLQNGKIDEIGAPHELAKTKGIYAQLLQLQMGTTAAARKQLKKFEVVS
ncbi:ABC transporter-related protein [candidate division TM7 genomosp. GTL1]|nr:ABC transporter-related protein [candidate division TM7 genomosp. GTL1]